MRGDNMSYKIVNLSQIKDSNIKDEDKFTLYNINKFLNGDENIILITGFSGSGKSTLAERYEYKYDAIHIDLNNLSPKNTYIYDYPISENNEVFYDYLDKNPELKEKYENGDYFSQGEIDNLYRDFIPYCIEWCKKNKENNYTIEGVQIYENPDLIDPSLPIIILNATAEESSERIERRDGKKIPYITSKTNKDKFEKFKNKIEKANQK